MKSLKRETVAAIVRSIKGWLSTDIFEDAIRKEMRLCVGHKNADAAHTHAKLYPSGGGTDSGSAEGDELKNLSLTGTFDKDAEVELSHGILDITKIKTVNMFVQI